jgi:8-oxo-dGTP diphosphatase
VANKREPLPQHFTASAVVVEKGHVLLVHHRRIGAWLPPGGHIDEFELPHEAAVREVFEETGIAVEIISEAIPETGSNEAFFLPKPLCIHNVKAFEKGQHVHHLDLAFLCRTSVRGTLPAIAASDEVESAAWVKLEEMDKLELAKNVKEALSLALASLAKLSPASLD